MPDTLHLDLRGRTYWYIRKVPPALRAKMNYPHTGKALLRVNLKTSDLLQAQRKRPALNAAFDAEVSAARKRRDGVEADGLLADAVELRRWVLAGADDDERENRQSIAEDMALENAEALESRLGESLATRLYQTATNTKRGTDIDEHLEAFIAQKRAKPHTNYKRRKVINALANWRSQLFVETINRDLAREFVEEVIAPGRKAETINGDLGVLSTYWTWLSNQRGSLAGCQNHWTRFRREKDKRAFDDKHRKYTDEEMRRLFCGTKRMRADLLDCATTAALTGARLEEIGTLKVKHLDFDALTVFLPGTKTDAAPRTIPLHPDLIIVLRPRTVSKMPDDWVFHELPNRKADALKGRASQLSQAFTRFRRTVGVGYTAEDEERSPVDFHSFRRWFSSMLSQHGTPDRLIDGICGWSRGDMQGRYTWSADVFEQMREAVLKVKMPTGTA